MPADRGFRTALIFTLVAAAFLLAIHGSRFVQTNDEGILLEPAQRIAAGESPYVDFFGYMSPGSYWIQAVVFRLFGVSLVTGRIPVIVYTGLRAEPLADVAAQVRKNGDPDALLNAIGSVIGPPSRGSAI